MKLSITFYLIFMGCFISVSYSQSIQPTDDEQLMLELINRARMFPVEEGIRLAKHPDPNIQGAIRFFLVDVNQMVLDFLTYPPQPPLAMNLLLTEAARRHSADLRDNNFQGHDGTDGSTLSSRVSDTGYPWQRIGENVFSFGRSIEHAHAGFVVDWGVPSPGHRQNTLEFAGEAHFTEVGIGILAANPGINGIVKTSSIHVPQSPRVSLHQTPDVGPLLVTIDFATTFDPVPKVLGVVFDDLSGNEFYDPGEGRGSMTVAIIGLGSSVSTFDSGGYTLDVSSAGNYLLELRGAGLPGGVMQKSFEIGQENVKVDFIIPPFTSVDQWMIYSLPAE